MWYIVDRRGEFIMGVDVCGLHSTPSRLFAFAFMCEEDAEAFINGLSAYFDEPSLWDFLHVEFRDE